MGGRVGRPPPLNDNETEIVCMWIDEQIANKVAIRAKDVHAKMVEVRIELSSNPDVLQIKLPCLSSVYRYIKKWGYRLNKGSLAHPRRLNIHKEIVISFLEDYKQLISDYHLTAENVYNFDETAFAIGTRRGVCNVVTDISSGNPTLVDGGFQNHNSTTIVVCVSSSGGHLDTTILIRNQSLSVEFHNLCND